MRRRQLASTLRQLRAQSGLTLEDAASHLEMSAATLSRIETGIRIPRARDVRDLVGLYGVVDDEEVAAVVGLVAEAKEPGWWEAYSELGGDYATLLGLETAATRLQQYEGGSILGPLQTPAYTRAWWKEVINPGYRRTLTDDEIEQRVEIRVRRQRNVLSSLGPGYEAIVDEAALQRAVGGPEVLRGQALRLAELSERDDVDIRLLPFSAGAHPGQFGAFTIITLPQGTLSDVVYVDSLAGELFLEDPQDLERHRRAWRVLRERALDESATRDALRRFAAGIGA